MKTTKATNRVSHTDAILRKHQLLIIQTFGENGKDAYDIVDWKSGKLASAKRVRAYLTDLKAQQEKE